MRHAHRPDATDYRASRQHLLFALVLTAGYAAVEALGGLMNGSLALLADAGQMVTDTAALGLALFAQIVSVRPASAHHSYGYARAEVLGALINSLLMLAMVGWIVFEAIGRLMHPVAIHSPSVVAIALGGLGINLFAAWLLAGDSHNMNSRAALVQVLGDLLGSLIATAAGLIVWATRWTPADPLLSLFIALLILRATWMLVLQSSHMLMEGVPTHLDLGAIGTALAAQRGVESVHDLHVWHIGPRQVALSAHVTIQEAESWPRLLAATQSMLSKQFGIDHATLQPTWPGALPRGKVIPLAAHPAAPTPGPDQPA